MPFLLTRPSRGVTAGGVAKEAVPPISTHTPLAGRDLLDAQVPAGKTISTHTPLAGRDQLPFVSWDGLGNFYSHAPRGA